MRVVVVDDEPPARRRLKRMLMRVADVHIVGEAETGTAAAELIDANRPDVAFVDVRLPDVDGFCVIRLLTDPLPAIVFVTAFDQHAIAAFDAEALDYLLKPVRQARLEETLRRVRNRDATAGALRRIATARPGAPPVTQLPVRDHGRVRLIPVDEIASITVERGLVFVTTEGGRFWTKFTTLLEVESMFRPGRFRRVHRQVLVDLHHVREVFRQENGTALLVLSCGTKVPVSRSHVPDLRGLFRL